MRPSVWLSPSSGALSSPDDGCEMLGGKIFLCGHLLANKTTSKRIFSQRGVFRRVPGPNIIWHCERQRREQENLMFWGTRAPKNRNEFIILKSWQICRIHYFEILAQGPNSSSTFITVPPPPSRLTWSDLLQHVDHVCVLEWFARGKVAQAHAAVCIIIRFCDGVGSEVEVTAAEHGFFENTLGSLYI